MTVAEDFQLRMRPEMAAGGFARDDGSLAFYIRIDALIRPEMTVLDFGAGRGAQFDGEYYVKRFSWLRGRVAKLIGVDIDPAVLENPGLDEAHVIEAGKPLPFADEAFDLIFADWVLEHIDDPKIFASEIARLLKPGGWFCARTPNKWGYVALAARLASSRMESRLLRFAQPKRQERDVFPKFYRLNTLPALQANFPVSSWENASYSHNPDPSYHGGRAWMFRSIETYQSLPLRSLDTVLLVFLHKIGSNAPSS